jgi:hypothetical protein
MPYRDEKEALRARIEELDKNLSSIDEKTRELSALREGESDLRRERDALRRKLRDLDGPRKLPTLDHLGVASPCHESWDDMVGDDTTRFCLKCEKNVYDLSSMTKAEAEALITAKEGKLCVRFFRRADGTILTADCPEGVARKRRRAFAAGVVGASLLAGGGLLAARMLLPKERCASQGAVAYAPDDRFMQGRIEVKGNMTTDPTPAPTNVASTTRVTPEMGAPRLREPEPLPFTPTKK